MARKEKKYQYSEEDLSIKRREEAQRKWREGWSKHNNAIQSERDPFERWNYMCDNVPDNMIVNLLAHCQKIGLEIKKPSFGYPDDSNVGQLGDKNGGIEQWQPDKSTDELLKELNRPVSEEARSNDIS